MSDELRSQLIAALERFADDLIIGRHGDPHVAFVVLVSADMPRIVSLTQRGSHDIRTIVAAPTAVSAGDKRGLFFTLDELSEAACALNDAHHALGVGWRWQKDKTQKLGEYVQAHIEATCQRRRDVPIEQALKQGAYESAHPWLCAECKMRFQTERGLKMHQARNWRCPAKAQRVYKTGPSA